MTTAAVIAYHVTAAATISVTVYAKMDRAHNAIINTVTGATAAALVTLISALALIVAFRQVVAVTSGSLYTSVDSDPEVYTQPGRITISNDQNNLPERPSHRYEITMSISVPPNNKQPVYFYAPCPKKC